MDINMVQGAGLSFPLSKLARILGGTVSSHSVEGTWVESVALSGAAARAGSIFVAVPGSKVDGHDFIEQAFNNGAVAAVVSDPQKLGARPGIVVGDTRVALSRLAALFAADPSDEMQVIGITGTNGKTTINWLLYQLLNSFESPCVRIGTLGLMTEKGFEVPGNLTTPDALEIQNSLRKARDLGCTSSVLEVSSHALDQHRADDVYFDVGVFTNLTRDHLDYHKEMESYFAAKRKLFELLAAGHKATRAAVINRDSEHGRRLIAELARWNLRDYSFGRSTESRIQILNFAQNPSGSRLLIGFGRERLEINSRFIGAHNAENLAAAFGAAVGLGYDPAKVAQALSTAPTVPGRLEPVGDGKLSVFVDYAHTPDALEHALVCLRELSPARLWVVFGCGGDRDRGKRPQMAEIAARLADCVVVTSDNPRTEDPQAIVADILAGKVGEKIRSNGIVEIDRRIALEKTLARAQPGDVVLVAGKGHEDYQIIGATKLHFSDQEEVRRILGS